MFSPVLWQGQKELSRLPARVLLPSGERPAPTGAGAKAGAVACVPPARTVPSARGFGVDVGTLYRERGRAGVAQFLSQVPGRAVLAQVFRQLGVDGLCGIPGKLKGREKVLAGHVHGYPPPVWFPGHYCTVVAENTLHHGGAHASKLIVRVEE